MLELTYVNFTMFTGSTISSLRDRLAQGSLMRETVKGAPMKVRRT